VGKRTEKMITEFLQDIKALGGLPFYIFITLLFMIIGDFLMFFTLTIALIISYMITILIRMIYFRERPEKVKYKTFLQKIDASSFPSMHTIRATNLGIITATAIQTPLFSMLAIPYILLVAFSRVKLKRHHLSDVIGGLFFGVLISLLVIWMTNLIF
jgi:membrane-associated phospholipid phosphatase